MNSNVEDEEVVRVKLSGGGEVVGIVYNVKSVQELDDTPKWWWEYQIIENDEKGRFFKNWDSYHETYNGVHKLTKESAIKAVKEYVEEEYGNKIQNPAI